MLLTVLLVLECKDPAASLRALADTVDLSSIALCGIYYYLWIYVLPKWGNYTIRQEVEELPDGAVTSKLFKVPNNELEEWDVTHDDHGNRIPATVGTKKE